MSPPTGDFRGKWRDLMRPHGLLSAALVLATGHAWHFLREWTHYSKELLDISLLWPYSGVLHWDQQETPTIWPWTRGSTIFSFPFGYSGKLALFVVAIFCLRQTLTHLGWPRTCMQPRMTLNSQSSCFNILGAELRSVHYHTRFMVLGIKSKPSYMLGKYSTNGLHAQAKTNPLNPLFSHGRIRSQEYGSQGCDTV